MEIFFLKKHAQNVVAKLVLGSKKLSISLDQQSDVLYSLFLFFVKVEDHQNKSKLVANRLL